MLWGGKVSGETGTNRITLGERSRGVREGSTGGHPVVATVIVRSVTLNGSRVLVLLLAGGIFPNVLFLLLTRAAVLEPVLYSVSYTSKTVGS